MGINMNINININNHSTGTSSRRRNENTVSFSAQERIVSIPCRSSLQDLLDLIWYSRQEIETITHDADQLVLEAEDSGTCLFTRDTLPDSLRGLERKTERGHMDSFRHRVAVYSAVLDSDSDSVSDNATLAQQSEHATREARTAAIQRAKQDQVEAQAIHKLLACTTSSKTGHSLPSAAPLKVDPQQVRVRLVNGKPRPPPKRQSSSFKRTTHLPRKDPTSTTCGTSTSNTVPTNTSSCPMPKKASPIATPTPKTTTSICTSTAPKKMLLPTTTSRSPKTLATTAAASARRAVRGKGRLSLDCACVFNAA
jgi:hypothetical protein